MSFFNKKLTTSLNNSSPMNNNFLWIPHEKYFVLFATILVWVWNSIYLAYFSSTNIKKIFTFEESTYLPGYKRDNSSEWEWQSFETNILYYFLYSLVFSIVSYFLKNLIFRHVLPHFSLKIYYIITGNILGYFIYKEYLLLLYIITLAHYFLSKRFYTNQKFPFITWAFSIISIILVKFFGPRGFLFYYPPHRCLSFSLDLHEFSRNSSPHPHHSCRICLESHQIFPQNNLENLPTLPQYSLINYYAYLFYPPMLKYGPMLGFHCWMRQINHERFLNKFPWRKVCQYGIKFFMEFILFIVFTHVYFCETILIVPMNEPLFNKSFYLTLLLTIFLGLKLWLKFLFFWRFHRLIAFFDQIDSPEDMRACFLSSFTVQDFWKDLHRSMHLWLLQYLYFPLGGNQRHTARNVFLVFAFFIATHNISFSHFIWGGLTGILIVFEVIMRGTGFLDNLCHEKVWGKYLRAMGTAVYLAMVLSFDLAVFVMGLERVLKLFGGFMCIEGVINIAGVSMMLLPSIVYIYHLKGF